MVLRYLSSSTTAPLAASSTCFLPKRPRGFCGLYLRLVLVLHVGDLGLLGALDHRQRALDGIKAGSFSAATETNNGRPERAWLRP